MTSWLDRRTVVWVDGYGYQDIEFKVGEEVRVAKVEHVCEEGGCSGIRVGEKYVREAWKSMGRVVTVKRHWGGCGSAW